MLTSRVLRQAAAHAERMPSIKFIGKRSIPSSVDHSPHPHPASPSGALPKNFQQSPTSFSSYRDHAQQFGPLRKTIKAGEAGVGGVSGQALGPVEPPKGVFFRP